MYKVDLFKFFFFQMFQTVNKKAQMIIEITCWSKKFGIFLIKSTAKSFDHLSGVNM